MRTNMCFESVGSEARRSGRPNEMECTSSLSWNTLSTENGDKAKGVFTRTSNEEGVREDLEFMESS